jgi:hypothetical protein
VAEGARLGFAVVISTNSPDWARRFAERLTELGVELLDAPTGARRAPWRGTLVVTVGDCKKTFQRLLPVFKAFGRNVIYVGPVGYGQAVRLVNQMAALNTVTVVEGLCLAKAPGLDVEKEAQVSSLGAARSGYCICRSTLGRPPARLQGGPPQEGLGLRHGGKSAKFISARHFACLGAVQDLWRRVSGSWGSTRWVRCISN